MTARLKNASSGDQQAGHSCIPYLPIGVVTEILCRLPIKTLIAAKCVSKSWRDLISGDTHFAKSQLSRSSTELLFQSATIGSASTVLYLGNIHLHNDSVSTSKSSPLFDLPYLRGNTKTRYSTNLYSAATRTEIFYVNTCNGFVCFSNDYRAPRTYAMICNPVTGEYITVTRPEKDEEGVKCAGYALGFSRKANRYKVLRVLLGKEKIDPVTGKTSHEQFVEICTIEKGSSWRNVGDCPYFIGEVESKDFVFLEGKLHFVTKQYSVVIACFDFDSEEFQQVPVSDDVYKDGIGEDLDRVGVFRGCLLINIFHHHFTIATWVMKEYGVKDSWTKIFTYSCGFPVGIKVPLKCLGNGDILMLECSHLVSYNPVTGDEKRVTSMYYLQVFAYRPSLLRFNDALMGYDAPVLNAKPR